SRLFLGGKEIDRRQLARDIATADITPIPSVKAAEKIDDFEGEPAGFGLRSAAGTLWVNSTDSGNDHTNVIFTRVLRQKNDHALALMARMSEKDRPFARVVVPLSRGAVEPADARAFKGVRFDARGDGDYRLIVPTRGVRDSSHFQAPFKAGSEWQTATIEFASLKREGVESPVQWKGDDLLMLVFEVARKPGEVGWLELDNIRFTRYRTV